MLPPDAPSGAGSPPEPAASSAAGSAPTTPAATSPEKPFSTPADDYKSQYEELQGKYKAYEKYGSPEQLDEAINWAKARAAEIQAGKLRLVDDKPATPAQPTDDAPPANWDDMSLSEQREWLRADARKAAQAESANIEKRVTELAEKRLQTVGMQQQIWMQASKLSAETGVPFEEAMAECTRIASLDSHGLLELAFKNKADPARIEKEIERRVNEAIAKQTQERENAEMQQMVSRGAPRFATEPAKDRNEQRQQSRMTIARKIREEVRSSLNRGRGAA